MRARFAAVLDTLSLKRKMDFWRLPSAIQEWLKEKEREARRAQATKTGSVADFKTWIAFQSVITSGVSIGL